MISSMSVCDSGLHAFKVYLSLCVQGCIFLTHAPLLLAALQCLVIQAVHWISKSAHGSILYCCYSLYCWLDAIHTACFTPQCPCVPHTADVACLKISSITPAPELCHVFRSSTIDLKYRCSNRGGRGTDARFTLREVQVPGHARTTQTQDICAAAGQGQLLSVSSLEVECVPAQIVRAAELVGYAHRCESVWSEGVCASERLWFRPPLSPLPF